MTIIEAFNKTKTLQNQNRNAVVKIVKKNYSGYDVQIEPVELTVIKNSLEMISQNANSFMANVNAKYGK
ncbi:TPA: hypothetical protein RPW15_001991 [Campylobacter fetus subsp. venerealis]|uniref:Uncharacterized protein n=1 Tax=Campylobacter fetus subsp. venerealis NCTC 10354 TaxID=983328 RepID=A0AAE6IY81_CAMFE|nr:hypothetical protein [Campylobacter fetus]OCS25584.1 hypothetical protein CFVB10_07635 [Campylobacter fetus subsp. venerealis cfvB10]OCS29578.1 hypothetical protein CFVCCUG33900_05610 [Campylobacter fetus subsp. venerealis LMG 6570 = CCUG 33900]AIR80327.1 hypothetical protein CFV97608_0692 [Campylobacter fetus subsp. venerealis 97/608]EAK0835202.1 hypothetical protein [Campylobacter fetus]EGU23795.1 Hypothetical protein CFV354_0730 [Campylobacter fetus subsp. venerealis NCTC 10354]